MVYFKVVKKDLTSVGLLGAFAIRYKIGRWVYPKEQLSTHPRKGGGLWVVKTPSDAQRIKKYLKRKHQIDARIFVCLIGEVLYETSYRVKTSKVMLTEEILDKKGGMPWEDQMSFARMRLNTTSSSKSPTIPSTPARQ